MLNTIIDFFSREEYMPHGACFLWYPEILYSQAISDILTGMSYYSVAIGLIYFVLKREDIPFKWFFIPFGTLVFAACGTVHFLGAWTLWTPDFGVQTVFKVITAIVSLSIGIIIWPLMPRIIALPSPRQFAAAKLELAEVRLKQAEKAVDESEQRFRDFAENGADWFWETDADLKFSYIAGKFKEILGMSAGDILGKDKPEVYRGIYDLESPKWKQHLVSLKEHLPISNYEYSWTRSDGTEREININGTPRFDETGIFLGYRGVGRDVTERAHLEEQIRRAQKLEAVGQLTSGIAHDFNNILGIVQGNLEILKGMLRGEEKVLERISKAQKGVSRGADITRKLLGFSRKAVHDNSLTNVNVLIENLTDLIAKSLTASIEVKTELDDDLWSIVTDAGELEDAILNLSLNARDAMPDGGMLTIETRNKVLDEHYFKRNADGKPGDYVMILVSDTGVGMSEKIQTKVLEPFFTTKELGKGTGLGLSMVYGLVQRSGGHLKIYSELGNGTTVCIFLPRFNETAETEETEETEQTGIIEPPRGTEKILVVDDEEELLELAELHLQGLGYETVRAENGKQALDFVNSDLGIQLIISDVVMPGRLDGYQLALKVREIRPNIRILLTSGFSKAREEVLQGENLYLSELTKRILNKPYNLVELAQAVRGALDRS